MAVAFGSNGLWILSSLFKSKDKPFDNWIMKHLTPTFASLLLIYYFNFEFSKVAQTHFCSFTAPLWLLSVLVLKHSKQASDISWNSCQNKTWSRRYTKGLTTGLLHFWGESDWPKPAVYLEPNEKEWKHEIDVVKVSLYSRGQTEVHVARSAHFTGTHLHFRVGVTNIL